MSTEDNSTNTNEQDDESVDSNIPTANNTTYITLSPRSSPDVSRKKKSSKKKKHAEPETSSLDEDRDQSLNSPSPSETKNDDDDAPIDANLSSKLRDENEIMKKKIERKHLEEENLSDSQMSSSPGSENGSLQIQRVANTEDNDDSSSDSSDNESKDSPRERRATVLTSVELEENFILDILIAIRTCTLGIRSYNEQPKEFTSTSLYKVSRAGTQKRFMVKDFSPKAFRMLRLLFNVSTEDFLKSWSSTNISQVPTTGKSNSTFIFSPDKKYVLKTLTKRESKNLRDMIGDYYQHMTNFPGTFLQRIYGHYRMDVRNKKVYFVVIGNVLDTPRALHETHDLKGFESETAKMELSSSLRDAVLKQLEEDFKMLERNEIIDYSVLIGVSKNDNSNAQDIVTNNSEILDKKALRKVPSLVFFCEDSQEIIPKGTGGFLNRTLRIKSKSLANFKMSPQEGNPLIQKVSGALPSFGSDNHIKEYYYIGVIDLLKKYNKKQQITGFTQSIMNKTESIVPPKKYAKRILEMMENAIGASKFEGTKETSSGAPLQRTVSMEK